MSNEKCIFCEEKKCRIVDNEIKISCDTCYIESFETCPFRNPDLMTNNNDASHCCASCPHLEN